MSSPTSTPSTPEKEVALGRVRSFIERQKILLAKERAADAEQNNLLLSDDPKHYKTLQARGLALVNLTVIGVTVGLSGKSLVELGPSTAYSSNDSFPPHSLRVGDLACIVANAKQKTSSATKKAKEVQVDGVVHGATTTKIVVAVDPTRYEEDFKLPDPCTLVKLGSTVTYDRMEKTLDLLLKKAEDTYDAEKAASTSLLHVLLGLRHPSPCNPIPALRFHNENLNKSQQDAVRFALESPEVACIHGPPGTGKTQTLVEIIQQIVSPTVPPFTEGKKIAKVLVCGASNLAVDNILQRLIHTDSWNNSIPIIRIGHPARVVGGNDVVQHSLDYQVASSEQAALANDAKKELEDSLKQLGFNKSSKGKSVSRIDRKALWNSVKELRKELKSRKYKGTQEILKNAQVVFATCHTAGGKELFSHSFDVLIIDEATQALESSCWIPILKASKVILAGDPLQLPPTVLSSKAQAIDHNTKKLSPPVLLLQPSNSLEFTLFDRLEFMIGSKIISMLTMQYRMNQEICAFPNQELYASKLQSAHSVANHLLKDLDNIRSNIQTSDEDLLAYPVIFLDTAGCQYFDQANSNDFDASKSNQNEALIAQQWIQKLILFGVLASQIAVITPYQAQVALLHSLLHQFYGSALEIGTIDGMQGREKEVVIISLVRSNEQREIGFLQDYRRLNVAMTRARRHLCIIGDSATIQKGTSYLKNWVNWLEDNAHIIFVQYNNSLDI